MSDELEEPAELTPIEQSRLTHGFRYYAAEPATYDAMCGGVDAARGNPRELTKRGLPTRDQLKIANDGSGYVLIAIDCQRFTETDDEMMAPALANDFIREYVREDWEALVPE